MENQHPTGGEDTSAGRANTPDFSRPRDPEGAGGTGPKAPDYAGPRGEQFDRFEDPLADDAEEWSRSGPGEIADAALRGRVDVRERLESRLDETLERTADRLARAARSLHDAAHAQMDAGGIRGAAGRIAHGVAGGGESAAEFLRDSEVHDFTSFVEREVRERPIRSLLVAAASGWLVAKLVR
jgi:hypothetical protein